MTVQPAREHHAGYPGFRETHRLNRTLAFLCLGQVTVPLCLMLLLAVSPVEARRIANPGPRPQMAQTSSEPSCRGKIAVEPPPCKGDFAVPPPCSGEIALPEPPPCAGAPMPHPPPIVTPQQLSLERVFREARDLVGTRLTVQGTLGRSDDVNPFDRGYYLFQPSPTAPGGQLYGLPLIGDLGSLARHREVTVEGRVVRLERAAGAYFALQVDRADPR